MLNLKNVLKIASRKNKFSKGAGFTIVELIVVVAITAILAAMVFANMRHGGRTIDLNSDAEKLATVIKQAQMMALSGEKVDSSRADDGYGVYFDTPNSYKLFANTYSGPSHLYEDGQDMLIREFDLTAKVTVSPDDTSIIFVPPRGTIYVDGVLLVGGSISKITLTQTENDSKMCVEVNSQGKVDVYKLP